MPQTLGSYSAGMADKNRVPRPLGWCSRCLARGVGEHPAVTMNGGSGLCRECNAVVGDDQYQRDLLAGLASHAQQTVTAALGEARRVARALDVRRPG